MVNNIWMKVLVLGIIVIFFNTVLNFIPTNAECKNYRDTPRVFHFNNHYDEVTVPECVEIGDILIMDMTLYQESKFMIPGPHNEHTALYIGDNKLIHAGGDGISPGQVVIRYYSRFYRPAKNLAFVRVITANNNQTQAAVDWALKQRNASFQPYLDLKKNHWFDLKFHNPDHPWWPNASEWYCSELPWAAYYNQGIDIDSNGWRRNRASPFPAVAIYEIINDDDTKIIYRELDDYIEIIHPNRGTYVGNKQFVYLPYNMTIVWGKINVVVNTSFEDADSIEFYVDDELKNIVNTPSYEWTWDVNGFGRKYRLKVVALNENKEILGSYELNVRKFF
jgi:hypothetical protein